jgi:Protein of unknown function (DUF3306)
VSEAKSEPKGVLARWSQRKLAARRGEVEDEPRVDEPVAEALGAEAVPPETPEPEAPELPPIETLDFHSDYTAFLAKNVPEALRRAALRKLWVSDPVLANLDGLNDYDEDYNVVDQVITLAQTGYRPGLGYLDEAEKKLDEAEKKLARIDEAMGGPASADSQAEPAPSDHSAAEGDVSDNVAVEGESAAATRQPAATPEPTPPVSAKEPGK